MRRITPQVDWRIRCCVALASPSVDRCLRPLRNLTDGDDAQRRKVDGLIGTASVCRKKGIRARKPWRHPLDRAVEVPYPVAAAIALMEMGISEYRLIAEAVGLTEAEVRGIDTAEDALVRQLAVAGIPISEFFKLDCRVRCPKCQAMVVIAPCVSCRRLLSEGNRSCDFSSPRVAT